MIASSNPTFSYEAERLALTQINTAGRSIVQAADIPRHIWQGLFGFDLIA
jgi:hypothetical protein